MTADLSALADRVEREEPSAALWEEALLAVHGERSPYRYRFHDFVQCQAWRDAAAMLMPPEWEVAISTTSNADTKWGDVNASRRVIEYPSDNPKMLYASGHATGIQSEARARLAAALRVHAATRSGT